MSHKGSLGSSWSMASSSSSSSDEDKSIQDTKRTAYARVELARQATQLKSESKKPIRRSEKESAIAGGSDEKKSSTKKQKTTDDDTVFVSEQSTASNGTDGHKMAPKNKDPTNPETSKASEKDTGGGRGAPSVSSARGTLDEDPENIDDVSQNTFSIASDEYRHFIEQKLSTRYEMDGIKDNNKMRTDGDASSNDMSSVQDLRTTSITSSMIEVETSRSSKDSMFSSTSSAFEEINSVADPDGAEIKGEAKAIDGNGNECSSGSDEKPLPEYQVDDDGEVAKEKEKEEASGALGMFRKYWCYLLFSPFIVGNLMTVGRSILRNI